MIIEDEDVYEDPAEPDRSDADRINSHDSDRDRHELDNEPDENDDGGVDADEDDGPEKWV